jgi:KaiC/GvpD/RAD55 family RecA-like ATPase
MQNADVGSSDGIDSYAKEVEEIVEMLDALKEDLERKETLLMKVEETLEDTEKVLEKKIQEIVEKDNKLKKIEDILLRKEEDMKLQEEELQTNAALEYLSFKVREEDLASIEEKSQSGELEKEYGDKLRQLEEMLETKELQLRDMQEQLDKGVVISSEELSGEGLDAKMQAKLDEVKKKETELEEMKDHLMMMESRLRDEQEDLMHEATKIKTRMARGDQAQQENMSRKEEQLEKMEGELLEAQKEVTNFKKILEDLELKLQEKEDEIKEREDELSEKSDELLQKSGLNPDELKQISLSEDEIKYRVDKELKKKEIDLETKLSRKSERRIKPLMKKIELLERRNDELENLEGELERARGELSNKESQMTERFDEISFLEKKMAKREERIQAERMQLEEERKKVMMSRDGEHAMGVNEELQMKNEELKQLEDKLREREEFLKQKESEIQRMEDKVISTDLEMEIAVEKEKDIQKIKTGVRRLDDLMYGGLPLSSNIFIYGPPFTGKQTLLNLYIAEGLKKGIPAIYLLIDKTPSEIRDNLKLVLPKVATFEKKGLLHYIDAYSRGMGIEGEETNTIYVDKPTDMDDILMAVTNLQKTMSGKSKYHKIALHSVSTLMAYSDAMTTFRFLQTLTSRCKRSGAASMFVMDRGMFSEAEVQTLKHLMNGVIEFKTEDLKNYLRVEGIGDVRTRGWIEYSHSTNSITLIGSFAVDHIR